MQKDLVLPRIDVMKETKTNRQWDLKKIIFVGIILAGIIAAILFFKFYFFAGVDDISKVAKEQKSAVKGISTKDIQNAVQDKIDLIKEQADNVNVTDIATSSPQIQKVINDIKSLENYPVDQARSMCENLCKGL